MRDDTEQSYIRVLVADNTRLHTQLLADALKQDENLGVIASDARGLITRKDLHEIDVILMSSDLEEQNGHGFEILRQIRALHDNVRAVMFLNSSKDESVMEAFRSGARGVLSRQACIDTVRKCLLRVHQGQIWANSQQMLLLLRALGPASNLPWASPDRIEELSRRELEVVDCVAEGLTNREVAKRLGLSQHTVKNYLFKVFEKLAISNRTELLSMLLRSGPRKSAVLYSWEQGAAASLPDKSALSRCQQAAYKGVLSAQLELAAFHWVRRASPKHSSEAYKWYLIVQDQVSHVVEASRKSLTAEEMHGAEEIATKWLKQHRSASVAGDSPPPAVNGHRARSGVTLQGKNQSLPGAAQRNGAHAN